MGVPDDCVAVQCLTTPKALRDLFHMVSQSAIKVSQSKIAPGPGGGFFGP